MAIIPNGEQFRSTIDGVDLTNRGSALQKKNNNVYTMGDIVETVNAQSTGLSYKSIVGAIGQSGTNNPNVVYYHNDFDVEFNAVRAGAGLYSFTLQGEDLSGSDISVIINNTTSDLSNPILNLMSCQPDASASAFYLTNYNFSGTFVDGLYTWFDFRVYNQQ